MNNANTKANEKNEKDLEGEEAIKLKQELHS